MDIREKLNLLGAAAQYDDRVSPPGGCGLFTPVDEAAPAAPAGRDLFPYVSHVTAPGGQQTPILKVLQTSACQHNCRYCMFRAGRDFRRAHFAPDELARGFDLMYRAGVVRGMFLSSGIIGTARTMDEMLATAELLRGEYEFRGYLHLKLLPGADPAHVARAVELADRVSTNLEAPTPETLAVLAPQKRMEELLGPLQAAAAVIRQRRQDRPAPSAHEAGGVRLGMSTQFVVGPAGESDRELLSTVQLLRREVRLARAYYSAFSPVRGTPLENAAATDPQREFRLYQADFLLRRYGFAAEELTYDAAGHLAIDSDPKSAWARAHPERFPVEVNQAPLDDLLRVPGIGPVSAHAIVEARRNGKLRELGDLRRLGARADQAAPYVVLAGRRPPWQMPLPWPEVPVR